ncbi:lysosomal acid phosphatase-like [Schistocerca cancellata]|uniref:lysosomal acid phosphatase-like n=1 Tax=Schistocerca cancellata TaxID=274614 RepID=UPI002118AAA9|nr:lysosomal acid phosphatase-like [Schistocerca cancellata]
MTNRRRLPDTDLDVSSGDVSRSQERMLVRMHKLTHGGDYPGREDDATAVLAYCRIWKAAALPGTGRQATGEPVGASPGAQAASLATAVSQGAPQGPAAQEIFRHGDRTPTDTYPEDPYNDDKYWPEGWGALTNKGKMEMFTLGKFLRQRYNGFLSETYYPQEGHVRSSDNDRCLMSAETCLAGLYPPKGDQVWNPELLWQPIPIHATPRNLDALIVMKKPCPRYEKELQQMYNSPEIQKINEENSELYKYLSKHTGKTIQSILDVEYLYNTLEIEEKRKLQLPAWTAGYYPDKLRTLAAKSLALFSESQTMKRLNGGPLVKHIIEKMKSQSNTSRTVSPKFLMFSAHDVTIVNVLQTMGFTELLKPQYGAAVIVELHSTNDSGFEVKAYQLQKIHAPQDLVIFREPKAVREPNAVIINK